jgi:hemolysin III
MDFLNLREPVSAWSHGSWLLLSLPATWLLWRQSGADLAKRLSVLVFGLSLAFCYAGSTLYHGVRLSPSAIDSFDELDHIGIFVLIAGSYTPIAWNLMQGWWKWGTLTFAWFFGTVGTVLILTTGVLPLFWSTLFYLAMGWGALLCYFELTRILSHRSLFPLLLGGLLYSVGALLNLIGWPEIWPGVFGPHEVFHVLVMAGSLSHFWFVLKVVVPYTIGPWENLAAVVEDGETLALEHVAIEDPRRTDTTTARGSFQPGSLRASPRPD